VYRQPDHSMHSGLNVIDFPMHWNFESAGSAMGVAVSGDHTYNDATFNVVYVDSHDYAPDGAPEYQRFSKPQDVWAENLNLMFTFRGIPCLYYGSEIEFKKGFPIDKGPTMPLRESGRAYFGGYITGDLVVDDFASYSNALGNVAVSLKHPLSLHIQRLNQIRMAVPALRKGQYATEGVSGNNLAYKRRYTDGQTDSYVLVSISGNAAFNNILNGTYVDAVTGDAKVVINNSLQVNVSGKGNMRVYVLNTAKTQAPGKVGRDGKYLYNTVSVVEDAGTYVDDPEALLPVTPVDPVDPVDPVLLPGEQAVFFEKAAHWGSSINAYVYFEQGGSVQVVTSAWPGSRMEALGNGVYKFVFDEAIGTWKILFNDGSGNQAPASVGFDVVNGGYYTVDGLLKVIEEGVPTSLADFSDNEDVFRLAYHQGVLTVDSPLEGSFGLYLVDGRLVRMLQLQKGRNEVSGIMQGVYVVAGQKIVVW